MYVKEKQTGVKVELVDINERFSERYSWSPPKFMDLGPDILLMTISPLSYIEW